MGETQTQLLEWLDDLCVRFIINLPNEELQSAERICFQIEEAQWFYEDFVRPTNPALPSMNLRDFCLRIFAHCPLFSQFSPDVYMSAFSSFMTYKTRVPVRGAILLDETMEHVLLVKGWKKSASWSFPRGKINKDERDVDCAVREVYEETGYDVAEAGLIQEESEQKFIEVTMREQQIKLYVFRGVPIETVFQPRTRKEISKIQWYRLTSLPGYRKKKNANQHHGVAQAQITNNDNDELVTASRLYMVAPFLVPLKKWIGEQRRKDNQRLSVPTEDYAASGYDTAGNDLKPTDIADQYGQYEAAAQMRTADDPEQDLLSSLGFDQPAPTDTTAEDAAHQLKRMLKLGAESQSPQTGVYSQPDDRSRNLLSLLQNSPGKEVAPSIGPHATDVRSPAPQNPMPQAQNNLLHLLQSANRPVAQGAQVIGQTRQDAVVPTFQSSRQPQSQQPAQGREVSSFGSARHSQASIRAPGTSAVGNQEESYVLPAAPPASQLLQPQLSSHAKSLLDALRTRSSSSSSVPVPAAPSSVAVVGPHAEPKTSRKSSFAFVPASVAPSRRTSSQAKAAQSPSPASHTSATLPGPPSHSLPPPKAFPGTRRSSASHEHKGSSHQNALLDLFKSASNGAAQPMRSQEAPVELPTPVVTSPKQTNSEAERTPQKPLTILQRPKLEGTPASPPRVGSSGNIEVRAPTGPKMRSPRAPQRSKEGQRSARQQQHATPVQILKRPAASAAKASDGRLEAAAAMPVEPVELKGSTPKPFQPQILKRPQQSPSKVQESLAGSSSTDVERAAADKEVEQREALLSLFGAKKSGQAEDRSSLAQLLAKQGARKQSQDAGAVTPRQSGPQTPISPSDRGFLVSYLDGLVKAAK